MTASDRRARTQEPAITARKALPLLRRAVALAPHRADLGLHLARALFRTGANAEIVDRLGPVASGPAMPAELPLLFGRAAMAVGKNQLAAEALGAAAAAGSTEALGYLAEALYRLRRPDEALDAALRGLHRRPSDPAAWKVIARVLFGRREVERLWGLCAEFRARGARGAWFSAAAASAAATLGLEDEFRTLFDPQRWFSATQLSTPRVFNQYLTAELTTLRQESGSKRIDQLERAEGSATQELFARLGQALGAYISERERCPDDPLIVHRPASAILAGWAILNEDSQHHGWHIHQAGWISGVYYVRAPEIQRGQNGLAGAIEFGPYPFGRDADKLCPYRWHLRPEPGLLLLFPSHFAHRTWPTGVADPRICVAFDLRPSGRAADGE